jgi:hypothetical protein
METALETKVIEKALTVTEHAASIVIRNNDELKAANDYRRDVLKPLIAEIHEAWDSEIKDADTLHKNLIAKRNKYMGPADNAYKTIGTKMATYDEEVRELARKEQARMDEIIRKEREAEQAKADKKIFALMEKAGGMQEQIDALKTAIEASDNVMEIEKMERQVEVLTRKLEAAQVKAAEVQVQAEQAYEMPAPVIQAKPQVQGMSTRQVTELVSVDIRKLAEAVFMGTAPIGVFEANEAAIKKLVDAGMTLPGVVTRKKTIVNTRS